MWEEKIENDELIDGRRVHLRGKDTYELVFVTEDVGNVHVVSGGRDILL